MGSKRRGVDDRAIVGALEEARHPLSLREVAKRIGAHGQQRQEVRRSLNRLLKRGELAEIKGGRFMLASRKRAQQSSREQRDKHRQRAGAEHLFRTGANSKKKVTGRLVTHRDGYGFVILDKPIPGMEGDVFIPPGALGVAMHSDRVRVELQEGRRGRRGTGRARPGGRVEGRIVGVDRRAHETIVGQFRCGENFNVVSPYDERIRQDILIARGDEQPRKSKQKTSPRELDAAMVNVEIIKYPSSSAALARGRVLEVLGRPGEFGLDVELVIRKYHIPHQFPPEVQAEAERTAPEVTQPEWLYRQDFRPLPIVTIDGEDAKDFDDAVHVERRANGNYLLQVHIADVSHYVRPGTALDREARLRGTSVYFPDRAEPMLPFELSNGICSLKPKVDRLVLSCLMEINAQGEVVDYWFAEGVIRSAERMTYTAVNAALEGDAGARERYARLAPEFEKMRELALILNKKRARRGSIDFDLPEPVIRFDEKGQMVGITRSVRNIAHRLIEEFMLAANETVARFLSDQGIASLYRVHEEPDAQKVLEFEEIAGTFGYSLGLGEQAARLVRVRERQRAGRGRRRPRVQEVPERIDITPQHYQRLVERIGGRPEERILSYLMLRSLKQARYLERNLGHFALAADCYTHFTSPIRRYPDLIVHRLLKATLLALRAQEVLPAGEAADRLFPGKGMGPKKKDQARQKEGEAARGPLALEELAAVAAESSEAERRAADAERELLDLKKLTYMEQHLGEEFEGLVINLSKWGFWVELLELFVEGVVRLETLEPDADYFYREATRSIAPGRRSRRADARAFRLGDRLRVRVDRIDRVLKKVEFSVVG